MDSNWQRELLRREGLRPRKSLSQNFLVDESHLARIAAAAELRPTDQVLEIGAGLGGLTRHLAPLAQRLIAVEIDRRLAHLLRTRYGAEQDRVRVLCQDILDVSIPDLPWREGRLGPDGRYTVVSNLPYHVANRIIRKLYDDTAPRPARALLLVQDDVARRICARPGDMSLLSVCTQFHADCSIVLRIPPGAFHPVPKVRSALVRLALHAPERHGAVDRARVFRIAAAAFGHRRKQLSKSLSLSLPLTRPQIDDWLRAGGVEPSRRAETLSVEEWVSLAERLEGEGLKKPAQPVTAGR